jgi:hypothetical protein
VGTQKTESQRRRAERLTLGKDERPTLLPCPACNGNGHHTEETSSGRYRRWACRWCAASGMVDHVVRRLWIRYLRLRNVNRVECRRVKEARVARG